MDSCGSTDYFMGTGNDHFHYDRGVHSRLAGDCYYCGSGTNH